MRNIKYTWTFGLILYLSIGIAQDVHFSQFYRAPLHLNPALTGVFDCTSQFSANYRNQWSPALGTEAAFTTYSVSYQNKYTAAQSDYWGIGLNALKDIEGTTNFSSTQGKFSVSYSKYLGGRSWRGAHYLSFGADIAYVMRSIDFLQARYGIQNSNGIYNPDIPSGEDFDFNSFSYPDLAAGLLWYGQSKLGNGWYLGLAAHHLNRPDQSFDSDNSIRIYTRYTIHAGGEFILDPKWSILPSALYFEQGPSRQLNTGLSFKYYGSKRPGREKAWQYGLRTRFVNQYDWDEQQSGDLKLGMDALILLVNLQVQQFNIGLSYDINTSDLTKASPFNNAFEISLIYRICGPETRKTYCPAF